MAGHKTFRADLEKLLSESPHPSISEIKTSDDDGVGFSFAHVQKSGCPKVLQLKLMALNTEDYPYRVDYLLFTEDNDVDSHVLQSFDVICHAVKGKPLSEAINRICERLDHHAAVDPQTSSDERGESDESSEFDEDIDDDDFFGTEKSTSKSTGPDIHQKTRRRMEKDLLEAKRAGFKVGAIQDVVNRSILCISIHVTKLGISEEAMKAWGLERQSYLALLIHFPRGYRSLAHLKEDKSYNQSCDMRVGLCRSYKPNQESANRAFAQDEASNQTSANSETVDDFTPVFIGQALNDLLRKRFMNIVTLRERYVVSWHQAEIAADTLQGLLSDSKIKWDENDDYDTKAHHALPAIVMADSLSGTTLEQCSLPLVAMQFVLRHFVRCTEFCLVCHCSVKNEFEALKPYVCSKPLCLYQYMALGFGPAVEWEIISQPHVVDLLISFCYARARWAALDDFPTGLNIKVPFLPRYLPQYFVTAQPTPMLSTNLNATSLSPGLQLPEPTYIGTSASANPECNPYAIPLSAQYDSRARTLTLRTGQASGHDMKPGDWIAILSQHFQSLVHHRIEAKWFPVINLGPPLVVSLKTGVVDNLPEKPPEHVVEVQCYQYGFDLDQLPNDCRIRAILTLLDTVPTVDSMYEFLKSRDMGQHPSQLKQFPGISESGLSLLRWIVASNRSCIMQVDRLLGKDEDELSEMAQEGRVKGMEGYMQFRFAQGAPDKEERFLQSVKRHSLEQEDYPTIFAWHGSPVYSWHSIVREGLNSSQTLNGRAHGDGVYLSSKATLSLGYSSRLVTKSQWPNSRLQVLSALSLNEVVNKTDAFVSRRPHFVVADNDWIQTRYLFVKTGAKHTTNSPDLPSIPQDPRFLACGNMAEQKHIEIPITALSSSRRKQAGVLVNTDVEDGISVRTTDEDLEILGHESEGSSADVDRSRSSLKRRRSEASDDDYFNKDQDDHEFDLRSGDQDDRGDKKREVARAHLLTYKGLSINTQMTGFRPGQLDKTQIKFLPPPTNASMTATKALLREFNRLIQIQQSTPQHELGWFMQPDELENVYQWIVEFHTFEKDLPLAQDMEELGLASIVLEFRFTNQFPHAPPFVRVVKPRFIPLRFGGGGHVLEGGAFCMELLTNQGWSPVSTIESVLLQIRLALCEMESPARLIDPKRGRTSLPASSSDTYGIGEAMNSYRRACLMHGWPVPESFSTLLTERDGSS